MRVSKDLVAGSSVERAAFRILDARIVIECGFLCSTRVANTLCARKGIDVRKIKVEIACERSELRWVRYSGVRILGCNLCQLQGGAQHAIYACAREVTGISAGRTLAVEDTDANCLRTRLFQRFNLAEADYRGELVAFADHALRGSSTAGHGAADDILGKIL